METPTLIKILIPPEAEAAMETAAATPEVAMETAMAAAAVTEMVMVTEMAMAAVMVMAMVVLNQKQSHNIDIIVSLQTPWTPYMP